MKELICNMEKIEQFMNLKNIEVQLACQCAPVITGLKASNLLITDTKNIRVLHRILSSSDISYFILFSDKEKTVLFLFHKYRLESFLKQENIRRLLMCFLSERSVQSCVSRLK